MKRWSFLAASLFARESPLPAALWRPLAVSCLFAAMAGGLAVMLRPELGLLFGVALIAQEALALAALGVAAVVLVLLRRRTGKLSSL